MNTEKELKKLRSLVNMVGSGLAITVLVGVVLSIIPFFLRSDYLKSKVIYEIYPQSFNRYSGPLHPKKSMNEAERLSERGNFWGIIDKLDYLKELGVDYIWLTPSFSSPLQDNGYDIDDWYLPQARFGNLNDYKILIEEAEKRKMRLMTDFVLGSTSKYHPWFQWAIGNAVRTGIDYSKQPYFWKNVPENGVEPTKKEQQYFQQFYYFEDPAWFPSEPEIIQKFKIPSWCSNLTNPDKNAAGKKICPPTNLDVRNGGGLLNTSTFQWQWLPHIQKYYLGTYSHFQPDLRWEAPEVRQEIAKYINFWASLGLGGSRFDTVNVISKQTDRSKPDWFNTNKPGPKLIDFLEEVMKSSWGKRKNFVTLGEISLRANAKVPEGFYERLGKIFMFNYRPIVYLPLWYEEWNRRDEWKDYEDGGIDSRYFSFPRGRFSSQQESKYSLYLGQKNIRVPSYFRDFVDENYAIPEGPESARVNVLESHDHGRSVLRFAGCDVNQFSVGDICMCQEDFENNSFEFIYPRAKALALFKFFQPGMNVIYQGEEIAMNDTLYISTKHMKEPFFFNSTDIQVRSFRLALAQQAHSRDSSPEEKKLAKWWLGPGEPPYPLDSRDNGRTTIPWDETANNGFCDDCHLFNGAEPPTPQLFYNNPLLDNADNYLAGLFWNGIKWEVKKDYKKRPLFAEGIPHKDWMNLFKEYPMYYESATYLTANNPPDVKGLVSWQIKDKDSPFWFYKRMLALRKKEPAFAYGNFKRGITFANQRVATSTITYQGRKYLVMVNLDAEDLGEVVKIPRLIGTGNFKVVLNTHSQLLADENFFYLQAYQGVILRI